MCLTTMLRNIKSRPLIIKLDSLPHKKLWIPNYGELVGFKNHSDGDCWDVLVPGYPQLNRQDTYYSKELLGIYYLPNENHKLIIDIFHEEHKRSKQWINEVIGYQKKYEKYNNIKGDLFIKTPR